MLKILNKKDKEDAQKKGYMCEHLICLYSTVADQTALYNDNFPVFISQYDEADVILFGLKDRDEDKIACVKELTKMPIKTLNTISPKFLNTLPNMELKYSLRDYHINVNEFDLDLKGHKYKRIRYWVRQAQKRGYYIKLSRNFTPNHIYILSRHMTRRTYDEWDFEELLSLERFFREHSHGSMMEVYQKNKLIGFDVIDFFENSRIMVVPLGIYLKKPALADFLMYENLKYAKANGYDWLDIGSDCREPQLRKFKEKWFAKPVFEFYVQTLKIGSENSNKNTTNLAYDD